MDQRTQFIADHLRDVWSISEMCATYGISRKTGYKWIDRYVRPGPARLEERSRQPRRAPQHADHVLTRYPRNHAQPRRHARTHCEADVPANGPGRRPK